ncbi:hypothetical protein ABZ769_16505 [Streptomyces olivoreticuli]
MALLLAAALLALGFSAMASVYAAYDGIDQRSSERALQYRDAYPDRKPVALAISTFDEAKDVQHSVVYLRPLQSDASLPPGVTRWPAPGEAMASPGLVRALKSEKAVGRFGKIVGEIGHSGLASPGERLAYVNPTDAQLRKARVDPVVGFGRPGQDLAGDLLFIQDRGRLLNGLYLVLVPAAVLAVVAVRMGSAGRDKRTALVSALGGGWRARLWLNLGESAPAVLAGGLLGTLPGIAIAVTGDTRLPWIDYWLSSADLGRWWWALVLAGFAAAAVLLVLVCVMHPAGRRSRSQSARVAARKGKALRWAAIACPLLVFATVWGPAQLDPARYANLRGTLYNLGVALVLATLPCAVAVASAGVGGKLANWARRTGSAGMLISGRRIAAHPGVTARLVAGVGIALVVVTQVQLDSVQFGASAVAARKTAARIGKSLVVVDIRPERMEKEQLDAVLNRLPAGTEVLAVHTAGDPSTPTLIQGSCQALRAVRLECANGTQRIETRAADPRVAEAIRWTSHTPDRFDARVGAPLSVNLAEGPHTLLLASSDGGDLPVGDIKQLARDGLPISSARVGVPGADWIGSSNLSVKQGRWVIFFGVPGVLILALAVALSNLAEFVRFSRTVAPLSVLAGRRRVFYSTALWSLLMPLLGAVLVSLVAAYWLAVPEEDPVKGIELSNPMALSAAGALSALAVATWWWGARASVHQAARWRPYGE